MEFFSIIIILVLIVLVVLIFKLIKHLVKLMIISTLIFIIGIIIFSYIAYKDIYDLKENLYTQPKIILLKDNERIEAGFIDMGKDKEPEIMNSKIIEEYQKKYLMKDYETMLNNYYKIFIFDTNAFSNNKETIKIYGKELGYESLINIIKSSDPFSAYKTQTGTEIRSYGYDDAGFLKSFLFYIVFDDQIKKGTGLFIINEYRKGNVIIYPETISFKIMKIIPSFIIENKINSLTEEYINKSTKLNG